MSRKAPALPRLIGVIHLPALAGSPRSAGLDPAAALQVAGSQAVSEAAALARAGFDGVIIENFGDTPFYKDRAPAETVASMAVIAAAVRETVKIPLGINVLRNDARSALAIAAITGCEFIRVNVLSGVAATDQGLIEADAAELTRDRVRLGADVRILADAHVKHAQSLSSRDLALAVEELARRALADGVIVTGPTTGRPVDAGKFREAARAAAACGAPLYVGSGVEADSLSQFVPQAHGVIVGSTLRRGGRAGAPLDPRRIRAFGTAWRKARKR